MVKLPKKFSIGERVFAKVRGYPPWPARIEGVSDPNTKHVKYHVLFYGTKETGTCKTEDLFQYADNKDKFSKTVRRKFFQEGLQELEDDLKKNPNPVSSDSSRDPESAENVPENAAEDSSGKEGGTVNSTSGGDGDTESGNLVIDEGDKKKAVKRKSQVPPSTPDVTEAKKKRGRKSMSAVLAENTPKQDAAHDSQDEDGDKKVSRSGRKIKPKRFHDSYSDADMSIDSTKNDQSVRSRTKSKNEDTNENQDTPIAPIKKRMSIESSEISTDDALLDETIAEIEDAKASPGYAGRLLLVRTRDGQDVGIKLDCDRPDRFESEVARARWDLSVARNAMRLKEQIEAGDIAPELITEFLDFNVHVPEDESVRRANQAKEDAEFQQSELRLNTLRTESQIIYLDTQIRSSLGLDSANTDDCLEAMEQIGELQLTPLMLKKHAQIVETIKRLRRYVGNLSDWKLTEEETTAFKQKAEKIQKKAEQIYNKIKLLFTIPEDKTFWNTFASEVERFKECTKNMTHEEVFALLVDPTPPETVKPVEESTSVISEDVSPAKNDAPAEASTSKVIAEETAVTTTATVTETAKEPETK